MQIANKTRGTLYTVLVLGILAADAMSQTPAKTTPIPTRIIYWQVFKHVNFLERQADLAAQQGKDPSKLRSYYQTHAQMTSAEAAILKQAASNTVAAVQAIDSQINSTIAQLRATMRRPSPGTPMPPPSPQLKALQGQRDNVIVSQVATLQTAMGASRFQNLDTYVQTHFAQHITVTTLGASGAHNAPATGVPPFPPMQ